jgi:hypothetical protein
MKQLFFILLLLSNIASAFNFDNWESKISLDEAIQIARTNDFPLCKDGAINAGKAFKESCLYLDKYPKNRVFRYATTLLNERATVYLYFTKNSKKLYSIKVRWMKQNKEFLNTLYELLDKKYGKREIAIPKNIGDFIINTSRIWKENQKTIIQTKTGFGLTTLTYYDVEETHNEEREREKIKIEKKEKALIKDANKF